MDLVRSEPLEGGTPEGLHRKLTDLEATLSERANEITRTKADLAAFAIRYRQEVGLLHEELDELQRAIAEAELVEISRRLEAETDHSASSNAQSRTETKARLTSDAVRKLFRDVAKMIHPDLAEDESTRDRRHALMIEANRAYALGDEERLRWVLAAWARSPEAVSGSDPDAMRERIIRRIAEIQDELNAHTADLSALQESPMWKLKALVDEASKRGKDLMADMIRRLKRDILVERNRLDAMRHHQ